MEAEASNQWRFAQCFGDKGEVDEITEGMSIVYHHLASREGFGTSLCHFSLLTEG